MKILSLVVAIIVSTAAYAERLATCTVTIIGGESYQIDFEKWPGDLNSVGVHFQKIYRFGNQDIVFGAPFNNDLTKAALLLEHDQGGGHAPDVAASADMNVSPLSI